MGLCNICMADTPEKQEEIKMFLPLSDLLDRATIECLITVIRDAVSEELLLPVVVTIGVLIELIVGDRNLLGTFRLGFIVSIVDDGVTASEHHLTELQGLLGEGTRAIVFPCDSVRNSQNMKSQLNVVWWLMGCTASLLIFSRTTAGGHLIFVSF
jgi:hypothetical protein